MQVIMVCFSLLEQMKSPRVKAVVGVLQVAKSKSLKKWKELVRLFVSVPQLKPSGAPSIW